jgi:anti-sigma factor RsiW
LQLHGKHCASLPWRCCLSHPDFEDLLAYAGGELSASESARVEAHIARCTQCGMDAARLTASLAPPPAAVVSSSSSDSVLEGIRSWESSHLHDHPDVNQIKCRIESAIAPYIGSAAAARVMERISPDGGDMLCQLESVLMLFLGCSAAAELIGHIVDRSIVRP